jgi:hypothetical protein
MIAIVGALLLMAGEAFRSWGVGRPVAAWIDDVIVGAAMIFAAVLVGRPTLVTRCLFSAVWGVAVGMLYGSFFSKLYYPAEAVPGNFPLETLTALLGLALCAAVAGLVASILLPDEAPA